MNCRHGPGAVDVGRLVQRAIDVLQPGEQQERDKRRRLPHVGEHQRNPGRERVGEPRRRRQPEPREHRGGEAGGALEHEAPDERRDHGRNRPRQKHGRAHEPAGARHAVERQRQDQTGGELEGDRHRDEHGGVGERAPEPRVRQRLGVVGRADERPAEPRHAQVVQVQRLPERPEDREDGDERDDAERRQRKRPPEARLGAGGTTRCAAVVPSSSWCGRAELHLRQQRAHRRGRLLQRRARLLLARQRPMQRDLQDLGELAVDRRDRSRHRPFDDLPARRPAESSARRRARASSYSAGRVGNWPAIRARSIICSGCSR